MSHKFVSDPHKIVRSGQVVKVKVMEVDVDRHRIGLSLRLDDVPGQPAPQRRGGDSPRGSDKRSGQKPLRAKGKKGGHNVDRGGSRGRPAAKGTMADALKKAGF